MSVLCKFMKLYNLYNDLTTYNAYGSLGGSARRSKSEAWRQRVLYLYLLHFLPAPSLPSRHKRNNSMNAYMKSLHVLFGRTSVRLGARVRNPCAPGICIQCKETLPHRLVQSTALDYVLTKNRSLRCKLFVVVVNDTLFSM